VTVCRGFNDYLFQVIVAPENEKLTIKLAISI